MRLPRLPLLFWLAPAGLIAALPLTAARKQNETANAPADAAAIAASAQAAYQRGELTEAAKLFEAAAKLQPENSVNAYNAGIFFFQTSQPGKADKYMHRVLKLNPDHALAFFYLGLMAEKAGDFSKAVGLYSEAARRDRRVLEAGYNKEIVQSKLTMDVKLRRYSEGDRPLDFAPVAAPAVTPVKAEKAPVKPMEKPVERPKANPVAPSAAPAPPRPAPRAASAEKSAPPVSEIRIESRPPPETAAGEMGGPGRSRPAAPLSPQRPAPASTNDPDASRDERPPPPVYGPSRELPDIDKPY